MVYKNNKSTIKYFLALFVFVLIHLIIGNVWAAEIKLGPIATENLTNSSLIESEHKPAPFFRTGALLQFFPTSAAYVADDLSQGKHSIYKIEEIGYGANRRLKNIEIYSCQDPYLISDVEWSKKNPFIVYFSKYNSDTIYSNPEGGLYALNIINGKVVPLTSAQNYIIWGIDVSKNDDIAFAANDPGGAYDMLVLKKGQKVPDFIYGDVSFLRWSPDGNKIVAVDGGYLNVYTIDINQPIPTYLDSGIGLKFYPAWSPDGKWVVYHKLRSYREWRAQLYIVEPDPDAEPIRLTFTDNDDENDAANYFADWSPDSRYITYVSRNLQYDEEIFLIDTKDVSGAPNIPTYKLTDSKFNKYYVRWEKPSFLFAILGIRSVLYYADQAPSDRDIYRTAFTIR